MKRKIFNNTLILAVFLVLGCTPQKKLAMVKNNNSDIPTNLRKRQDSRLTAYSPPRIPHEIYEDPCLECHLTNETDAPMMPHKNIINNIINCRQCHVPQESVPLFRKNTFKGVPEAKKLTTAYKNSPPAIPHPVFMREKCLACHGVDSRADVINTKHPERVNCRQCHVPSIP